jgi:hypothetical protein
VASSLTWASTHDLDERRARRGAVDALPDDVDTLPDDVE